MDRNQHSDAGQRQPRVPPATPPVVNADANAEDAANVSPDIDDDSDAPGSQPAHFLRGREDELAYGRGNEGHLMSDGGDRDNPGEQPDEIVPTKPNIDEPDRTPDEVAPGQGDFDRPDISPPETPPQPDVPNETPPPD